MSDITHSKSIGELMALEVKPREPIIGPWCALGDSILVWAPSGVGKTWISLSMAFSMAQGGCFLKWPLKRKWRVLYCDGEMGQDQINRRAWPLELGNSGSVDPAYFRVMCMDMFKDGVMPNLSDPKDQQVYQQGLDWADVIIIDNLLNCSRLIDKYDSEMREWQRIKPWIQKNRGKKTIILVHHANKAGQQRGGQEKFNDADTVVALKSSGLKGCPGASTFEFAFEKTRNLSAGVCPDLWVEMLSGTSEQGDTITFNWSELKHKKRLEIMQARTWTNSAKLVADKFGVKIHEVNEIWGK